jgi:hypothetical protein
LEAGLAGAHLDDKVRGNLRQFDSRTDDFPSVRQVGIDFDADRLVGAGEQLGDLREHLIKRLARLLHVLGVRGEAVDVPDLQSMTDLVGLGAIEEHFHRKSLRITQVV